jgi:hypothetical protein
MLIDAGFRRHVCFGPIVSKKSKMPLQQNSRESELIGDFD